MNLEEANAYAEQLMRDRIVTLEARLAAAERLLVGVEWLCKMVEQEKFEDAWHQVKDIVRPQLDGFQKAYSAKEPEKPEERPYYNAQFGPDALDGGLPEATDLNSAKQEGE